MKQLWLCWAHWILRLSLTLSLSASAVATSQPSPADPLTATINTADAERFARLFGATNGKPSAEQIEKEYLDGASYGVTVFTPHRIVNATNLAKAVAANPAGYERAIRYCLPRLQQYNTDLRSIYLALHGLLPDQSLPQIYIVFGAGNSGGTAGPNAQVLGLEVICSVSGDTPEGLRTTLRKFFAHETVHTFQIDPTEPQKSFLLAAVLQEGAADFIASIVTGETPDPQRASWAAQRELTLWTQFKKDLLLTQAPADKSHPKAAQAAMLRWIENYKNAPPGWPTEVGYWTGMRIWQCYYQAATDKHLAIHDVISWNNSEAILRKSGYSGKPCGVENITSTQSASGSPPE